MNKLIVGIWLFQCVLLADAQTREFKRILAEKDAVDRETFFQNLKDFKVENSQFANVYYQMGKVELEIFSNLDPITERLSSRHWIYNAKVNFGLAKTFLDPKEIAKYPDWYDVKAVNADSMIIMGQQVIDESYAKAELNASAYEELLINYDQAVEYYLNARQEFITINTSAESLRELFLQTDETLKTSVKQVGTYFDSCIYFLDRYREIYQELPHVEKRKVNINLKQIDHFRMNGITPVNFLADDINLWDYGQWSKRFLELLREEVDELKEEIRFAYNYFLSTNDRLVNGDECIQAEVDERKFQRVINLIIKYDQESVLADMFSYLLKKLNYGNQINYEKNCNQIETSLSDDFLSRKARINQNLYGAFLIADSINTTIVSPDNSEESFMWFFQEMLDGSGGSKRFSEAQHTENTDAITSELTSFKTHIRNQFFETDSILRKTYELQDNLLVRSSDSLQSSFVLEKKLQLNDTLVLLSGSQDGEKVIIGAEPVELDFETYWKFSPSKGKSIDFFKIVGDSSLVIGGKDWMSQYYFNGKEALSSKLPINGKLLNVTVNDLTSLFTITQLVDEKLVISECNFGGKVLASTEVEIEGDFVGMFRHESYYHVFTAASDSSLNLQVVGEDGNQVRQATYAFSSTLVHPRIIKNDDQWITLIADAPNSEYDLVYSLFDYRGKVYYESTF